MINIKELRIGNILKVDIFLWKVDSIINDELQPELYFKENEEYNHYYSANPIPLTPEVLEKCGFVKEDGCYDNKYFINDGFYFFTIQKHDEGYILCVSEYWEGRTFQYLHQLQNLYFALTGEELVFIL